MCWKELTAKRRNGPKRHIELRERRSYHLKRKYGITADEYDVMLANQSGKCAICGRTRDSHMSLSVDHDAETGRIRGILCENCNRAIGQLKHSIPNLQAAIKYLS